MNAPNMSHIHIHIHIHIYIYIYTCLCLYMYTDRWIDRQIDRQILFFAYTAYHFLLRSSHQSTSPGAPEYDKASHLRV